MIAIINPGTGALCGATKRRAVSNMRAFVRELVGSVECDYQPIRSFEGRWDFLVVVAKKRTEVSMPGLPIEQIRDSRSAWTPRLYVDGSSWYWPFAISQAQYALGLKVDE
jgi:hypothetical protein